MKKMKQEKSDPDQPIVNEDNEDGQKSSFNAVCISSLVFAFVGIGVLLSLATWTYITTTANVKGSKATSLHSKTKQNVTFHKSNGAADFISKMENYNTGVSSSSSTLKRPSAYSNSKRPIKNYSFLDFKRPSLDEGLNLDESTLGRRIESISQDEVELMKEKLSRRHGKTRKPYFRIAQKGR